uniref:Uncharacterized protein n=1 Tax=Scleropages formosus TaxID=113540 RepID=A0A8C9R500_SCLFO
MPVVCTVSVKRRGAENAFSSFANRQRSPLASRVPTHTPSGGTVYKWCVEGCPRHAMGWHGGYIHILFSLSAEIWGPRECLHAAVNTGKDK